MKCPTDETQLVMSERSGIEIDYCPQCRGVWLDRGELDKIVERSLDGPAPRAVPQQQAAPLFGRGGGRDSRSDYRDGRTDQYGRPRKKESWLSELFD